jgi:hypothetical protein
MKSDTSSVLEGDFQEILYYFTKLHGVMSHKTTTFD